MMIHSQTTPLRVVVTFEDWEAARVATSISRGTIVKQYGRRLVIDLGRNVSFSDDARWIKGELNKVLDVELDSLITPTEEERVIEWNLLDAEPYGIYAESAWGLTNSTPQVVVAVLDTGMPSAAGNVFHNMQAGYDFISDPYISLDGDGRDSNASDPGTGGPECPEPSWHGLKTASILAARHDSPVRGVAQNCTLMSVRVLGLCSTGYASDVGDAIVWSAGGLINGVLTNLAPARVISMSFSGIGPCPSYLQSSITQAVSLGALLVAAAGNGGVDASEFFPANCKGVMTVAATTRGGMLAGYSNFGLNIALSAPGGDEADPIMMLSMVGGGQGTVFGMGTSFAVAQVAGVAAMVASLQGGPEDVLNCTLPFGTAQCCGRGILSAKRILQFAGGAPKKWGGEQWANGTFDSGAQLSVMAAQYYLYDHSIVNSGRPSGWKRGDYYQQSCVSGAYPYTSNVAVVNDIFAYQITCPAFLYVCAVYYQWYSTNELCGFYFDCCDVSGALYFVSQVVSSSLCVTLNSQGSVAGFTGWESGVLPANSWQGFPGFFNFGWSYSTGVAISTYGSTATYSKKASSSSIVSVSQSCFSYSVDSSFTWYISGFHGWGGSLLDEVSIYCSKICDYCPAGKYSGYGDATCSSCPSGTYSGSGAATCQPCSSITCGSNQYLQGCGGTLVGMCTACSTSCPTGQYLSGCGGLSAGSCISCAGCSSGYYRNGCGGLSMGTCSACAVCSVGYYSGGCGVQGPGVCNSCASGSMANSTGMSTCILCSLGSYASSQSSSVCSNCNPGNFANLTGSTTCTLCSPGSFVSSQSSSVCSNCNIGTFANLTGSTTCAICLPRTYAMNTGLSICSPCNAGSYGTGSGYSVCLQCSTGTYASSSGLSLCMKCIPGTYAIGPAASSC